MESPVELKAIIEEVVQITASYSVDVLGAVVTMVVGWTLAGWARRGVLRATSRLTWMDQTLRPLLASLARYGVLVITVVAVLNQFGVETTSIIAVLGAAGLAVGLALQGTLSNVAAGLMILILRPFRVGDYIDAGGVAGTVVELGLFITELTTPDNRYISVPNSVVFGGIITNYSRHSRRRLDVPVGVAYGADLAMARRVLLDLAHADSRVHQDPPPQVLVIALADSSVNLTLRVWTSGAEIWMLNFDLNEAVKNALDAAGIEIPFPQRVVELRGGGVAPPDPSTL